jgi:hypothetical protein
MKRKLSCGCIAIEEGKGRRERKKVDDRAMEIRGLFL